MNPTRRSILTWSATALAVSPLVGGLTLSLTGPSSLRKERDEAQREGLPLRPEDLRPQPPVRPEDNAGPLLRDLCQRYNASSEKERDRWERAAADLLKNPNNAAARADFDAGLSDFAELVALAEKSAALSHCDFHYDYSLGPNLLLPELATVRHFARVFSARALIAGNADAAFADIARAARLGNRIAETPILIAALVYSAVHAIADKAYLTTLKRFGPGTAARETLQAFGPAPEPAFYLRSEVVMAMVTMQLLREGKLRQGLGSEGGDSMQATWNAATLMAPIATPFWERQLLSFWREMYAAMGETRGDYLAMQTKLSAVNARWDKRRGPQDIMVGILSPVFSQAVTKTNLHSEALRHLREGALLLCEAKAATGHYPETIALPTDPFDNQPLRYRKEGDGCCLYSIGDNKRDDNGQASSKENRPLDLVVRL